MSNRKRIFKYILLTCIGLGLCGLLGLGGAYFYVASSLPRVETLSDYRPPLITRIYSDDGTIIAEYSRERRILVPVDKLPKKLVQAFVAAEDSNFFKHKGLDLPSIRRAAQNGRASCRERGSSPG